MTKYTNIFLILILLFSASCSSRKNKINHSDIIPEEDLTSIITELYLTDGLLTIPKINDMFASLDSLSTYYYIIEKYGYTKEQMNKTLKFYFIRRPKDLINIYDHVLGKFSELETYLLKEYQIEPEVNIELWKGDDTFLLPGSMSPDSGQVQLTLFASGLYILRFTATIFQDDLTLNPRINIFSYPENGKDTNEYTTILSPYYIKDGNPHVYSIILRVPDNTPTSFAGHLYTFDSNPSVFQPHAIIENISVTFSSYN